ncbi:NAD(P)/FAD-dependent oxidoreductase [Glycocaulis profundi]|nr:NAD(P)/FAD-dependent oxidoreductase [Glycocaulis profundi]
MADASASQPAITAKALSESCDIAIVGGGSAGIAAAASLLKRRPGLDVRIIEPSERHFYQPGWTMVGGGVFEPAETVRPTHTLIPKGARLEKTAVTAFEPETSQLVLADGRRLSYRILVAAPGLKLDWAGVDGLEEALGSHGVTSNYAYDLAPYTWELVKGLTSGPALFTQPPMPIKCAGAPQKAMYLSADAWKRRDRLGDIGIEFHNAGGVLFGVDAYVPALMEYVKAYGIDLQFGSKLVAVNGPSRTAVFERAGSDGAAERFERGFDMIHVCPPQTAPDVVRDSPLAGEGGWIDVDRHTLRHVRHANVFGLGDAANTPNAKTAAAARKQAPVAAVNALAALDGQPLPASYDGYGSCPLTVERGRIVLAEFGYDGKLLPSFPKWLIDGRKPSRLAWALKAQILPRIYWDAMLKGREWLARPAS